MNGPIADRAADVFIQVRIGSTRLPGKALIELGDRTCLAHVASRSQRSRSIRHVVVCTSTSREDAVLVREADAWGARSFTGESDNCLRRFFDCADHFGSDIIVRVCGDSPLVPPSFIDAVVTHMQRSGAGYVRMAGVPVGTSIEAFTVCALERALVSSVDPSLSDDLSYFVGRQEINDVRTIEPDDSSVQRKDLVLALNRPEDLVLLRTVFSGCKPAGEYLTLEEAISFLDHHPDVRDANKPYVQKPTRCDTRLDQARLAEVILSSCDQAGRPS